MNGYDPDQFTEPQSGLQPVTNLDDLFELFREEMERKYIGFVTDKGTIFLWEKFKKEKGLPAILV